MPTTPNKIDLTNFSQFTGSDSAQPVEGRVDKESQRAAWWIGINQNNILETGIYNLTKEETPVLVHFGNQRTQTWLLVRLEDPNVASN